MTDTSPRIPRAGWHLLRQRPPLRARRRIAVRSPRKALALEPRFARPRAACTFMSAGPAVDARRPGPASRTPSLPPRARPSAAGCALATSPCSEALTRHLPYLVHVERDHCLALQPLEGMHRREQHFAGAKGLFVRDLRERKAGKLVPPCQQRVLRASGGENRYLPRMHVVFHESLKEGLQHGNRLPFVRVVVELGFRPVRCARYR